MPMPCPQSSSLVALAHVRPRSQAGAEAQGAPVVAGSSEEEEEEEATGAGGSIKEKAARKAARKAAKAARREAKAARKAAKAARKAGAGSPTEVEAGAPLPEVFGGGNTSDAPSGTG